MNASKPRLILIVLWLVSLAGAYYFGRRSGGGAPDADSSVQVVTNRPEGIPSDPGNGSASSPATEESDSGGQKGEAVNIRALIAKVRSQLGGGPGMMFNPTAVMKAMAPMAELSEAQVREALAEVEATMTNPQQKMMFYSLLLGRLAETDGAGAMAYVEENLSDQGGLAMGITMSVVGTWARREPDAAWEWFLKNRENESASAVGFGQVSAVFSGMASKDLDQAFSRLEQIDDLEQAQAISGIAMGGAWDPDFRERLLERATSLPDETRKTLYQGVASQWAMMDPDGALEWLDTLSADERKPLVQQAGAMLMMSDPKRGADLMLQNASEGELSSTYSRIVGQWASRDPNGAGEWLNQQPQGPGLDGARSTFARNVVKRDPVSAMEWAKTIEDENKRIQSVRQVYSEWKKKDVQSAEAALDGSGLTPEQIEDLRTNDSAATTTTTTRTGVSVLRGAP